MHNKPVWTKLSGGSHQLDVLIFELFLTFSDVEALVASHLSLRVGVGHVQNQQHPLLNPRGSEHGSAA